MRLQGHYSESSTQLERWVYHAGTTFRNSVDDVICHISNNVTEQGHDLFIISDHSKILSPLSLQKPTNLTSVPPTWRHPIADYSVIMDIVNSAKANPRNVSVVLCSDLEKKYIIARFDAGSTITIKNDALRGILSTHINFVRTDLLSDLEDAIYINKKPRKSAQ